MNTYEYSLTVFLTVL